MRTDRRLVPHRLDASGDLELLTDDTGRVPMFVTMELALTFMDKAGPAVYVALMRSTELAELLVASGMTEEEVYDVEATATDLADCVEWTRELAGRCAR